jgi:hypothetical protein
MSVEATQCSTCDDRIERCEVCERAECSTAVCYGCLIVALGQSVPQPHVHGG